MKFTTILMFLVSALVLVECHSTSADKSAPTSTTVNDSDHQDDVSSTGEINDCKDSCEMDIQLPSGKTVSLKEMINSTKIWSCTIDNVNIDCPLRVSTTNAGKYCAVQCPGEFTRSMMFKWQVVFYSEVKVEFTNDNTGSNISCTLTDPNGKGGGYKLNTDPTVYTKALVTNSSCYYTYNYDKTDYCDIDIRMSQGGSKPLKDVINGNNKWVCDDGLECAFKTVGLFEDTVGWHCGINCPGKFTTTTYRARFVSDKQFSIDFNESNSVSCVLPAN